MRCRTEADANGQVEAMDTLTPRQERAAAMLAAGVSVTEAARQLRLRRQTISEWKNLEPFRALLNRLRRDARDSARGVIIGAATKASRKLEALLDSKNERAVLAAANAILGHVAGTEIEELEERLTRLGDSHERQGESTDTTDREPGEKNAEGAANDCHWIQG